MKIELLRSEASPGAGRARVLRAILPLFIGLLAFGEVACSDPVPRTAAKHVILISIDTLRRDHVSVYGYERKTTPHIDSLARSGIVFENAFAANTNTAVRSRYSSALILLSFSTLPSMTIRA